MFPKDVYSCTANFILQEFNANEVKLKNETKKEARNPGTWNVTFSEYSYFSEDEKRFTVKIVAN